MCAVRANTFVILNQTIVPYINFSHILFPAKFSTAHYLQIHILSHDYLSQRVAVVTAINVQIMFPESQQNSRILFLSLSLAYLWSVSLSLYHSFSDTFRIFTFEYNSVSTHFKWRFSFTKRVVVTQNASKADDISIRMKMTCSIHMIKKGTQKAGSDIKIEVKIRFSNNFYLNKKIGVLFCTIAN